MKKLVLSLVGLLCLCAAYAQTNGSPLSCGEQITLSSDILGEDRKLSVYVPSGPNEPVYASRKFPVIYLLGGPMLYRSVVGIMDYMGQMAMQYPQTVIVAIHSTDAERDFTPVRFEEQVNTRLYGQTSGGAEQFARFLGEELIPYVTNRYPVSTHRTLLGSGYAGLFTVYALLHQPDLFDTYLALSPELSFANNYLIKERADRLNNQALAGKALFIGTPNGLPTGMTATGKSPIRTRDYQSETAQRQFAELVKKKAPRGMHFEWKFYPKEEMYTIGHVGSQDALDFAYGWYRVDHIGDFFEPSLGRTTAQLMAKMEQHAHTASKRLGYPVQPEERAVNLLAYGLMSEGFHEQAQALFEYNMRNYPDSPNVYDSMGDYYAARGDKARAAQHFEKALTFREADHTRRKLEDLHAGN